MQLSLQQLPRVKAREGLDIPDTHLALLPERVLQFGTGVLLRALPDYFIHKANQQGIFNGRTLVVKSTEGSTESFTRQDNLYTVCVRGIMDGMPVAQDIIQAVISRTLHAVDNWQEILQAAGNPNMEIVISNTTEVGLQYVEEDISATPPQSFPGKLLAFLLARYQAFGGAADKGMVIIPTELITDNGTLLKKMLLQLSHHNNLDNTFTYWLEHRNVFCNSLVDRIVPGKPVPGILEAMQQELGYQDELLTLAEPFRLWAIEGDSQVRDKLSFHQADEGIVISPDISLYRELKLRLLNGTHTFCCGAAFLAGFRLTREASTDAIFSAFMQQLMLEEISPSIPLLIPEEVRKDYALSVAERFRNPYIDHPWLSISLQYTMKMKMRNVPLILRYYHTFNRPPVCMATAFASYLLFMQPRHIDQGRYYGMHNNQRYEIKDDQAAYFMNIWDDGGPDPTEAVLGNESLWGTDLTKLPRFCAEVQNQMRSIQDNGIITTITHLNRAYEKIHGA